MFENIKKDLARYYKYGYKRPLPALLWEHHQIWAIICYRFGRWLNDLRWPRAARFPLLVVYHLWWKAVQVHLGIYIAAEARIGPGLYIGHFGQIFVGEKSRLGANCNLSQGVTMGYAFRGGHWGAPVAGDRVYLAPGAKVIGPVSLGDGVVVGANAVMSKDAPENTVWAGIPARVIGYSGSERYMGEEPEGPLTEAASADPYTERAKAHNA